MPKKKGEGKRDEYERAWRSKDLEAAGQILVQGRGALERAYGRKVTAQEMANKVGVGQSTITRYEIGAIPPRDYPTAAAVADAYRLNEDDRNKYFGLIFGLTEEKLLAHLVDKTTIITPSTLNPIINYLLVDALWEKPGNAAQQGKFYGDLLESVVSISGRSPHGQRLQPLAGMARLIEAFGTGLNRPSDLNAAIGLAKQALDRYSSNVDINIMGHLSVFTLERMKARDALYIDEAEVLLPKLRECHPFIAGVFCEGLAKQYILSGEHTVEQTKAMTALGREYLNQANEEDWMIRFDEIEARAIFLQNNDPREGAKQMHNVIEKVQALGTRNINIRVLALGYEATMRLHAGESIEIASSLFRRGYNLARSEGIGYFMKALEENAKAFGIAVKEEEDL